MPQALLLGVCLNQINLLLRTTSHSQVIQSDFVNWEHRGSGAELWAHVSDGRAVCQRHRSYTRTIELNKLSNYTVLTKHLGDGQDNVSCGHAGRNLSGQLETNNLWNQHRNRLTKHCGLGFDTANTPTKNTKTINHGGVRVGTYTAVWVSLKLAANFTRHNGACKVFDVYLVHDTGARWNYFEVVECRLAPTKELVALTIAVVLELNVSLESVC
ncbi:unannotated protein [freshwater metagenome]|uniref:Unannotated protein n=1 Tax=freshwater metagenome TaxID=449393 RepID=A0A6J6HQ46_9ZZZZ